MVIITITIKLPSVARKLYLTNERKATAALLTGSGLVAQWITRLTTDQKILGSTPGKLVHFVYVCICMKLAMSCEFVLSVFAYMHH